MGMVRRIQELVAPYLDLRLDANGMTKIIAHLLTRENIPHAAYIGAIRIRDDDDFMSHSWIRLGTGEIVDFKSRAWIPDEPSVALGVFHPDATSLAYDGVEVDLSVSQVLFDVLTKQARQVLLRIPDAI